jgi:hypothetical protein
MVADSRFHRRSYAQRLVNAAKVVKHEVERQSRDMILYFFAESICQAGKAPHGHTHSQIRTFNVAGGNMLRFRLASDANGTATNDLCRTVGRFWIRKENRKSESKFRIGRRLRAPQARPSAVTYSTDESGWADVSMNLENGVSRVARGALPGLRSVGPADGVPHCRASKATRALPDNACALGMCFARLRRAVYS